METKRNFHVLIIGAGSTGLLVARGLQKAGISHAVYERADADTYRNRQRDWTMGLHWGSHFIGSLLGEEVAQDLKQAQTDPYVQLTPDEEASFPIANGKTGELVARVPTPSTRRISRERLRGFLAEGVDIRLGSELVAVSEDGDKVIARFSDGHEAVGDALVGCDSGKSYVRSYLLGPDAAALEQTPVTFWNFCTSYEADQAKYLKESMHPLMKCAAHPEIPSWFIIATAQVPDQTDPATWTFHVALSIYHDNDAEAKLAQHAAHSASERLAHLKSLAQHFCEPFRSAALWIKDGTFLPYDTLKHWKNHSQWDNRGGRITLAGDAAHPMLPHRGQGLNNGLQDAALYVQAITKVVEAAGGDSSKIEAKLKEEVAAYDAEMFQRGSSEIDLSAKALYLNTHWEEMQASPIVRLGMHKANNGK